jgi:hypothetical protein
MKLGPPILKILSQKYEPSTMVERRFKNIDLAFKTDEQGRPILLFLGEKDDKGVVKGERFARRITTANGAVKDFWEHKGKAT